MILGYNKEERKTNQRSKMRKKHVMKVIMGFLPLAILLFMAFIILTPSSTPPENYPSPTVSNTLTY
jgi:hypothetical protein